MFDSHFTAYTSTKLTTTMHDIYDAEVNMSVPVCRYIAINYSVRSYIVFRNIKTFDPAITSIDGHLARPHNSR